MVKKFNDEKSYRYCTCIDDLVKLCDCKKCEDYFHEEGCCRYDKAEVESTK